MKNKKTLGICSLVLAILGLGVPNIIAMNTLQSEKILVIVCLVLCIAAVVLGFMGKSEAKGLSIAGIVIGIIGFIIIGLTFVGLIAFSKVKDCVVIDDTMSTCDLMGQPTNVPTQYLNKDQMKKDEE